MIIYFLCLHIASWFNRKARLLVRGQKKTIKSLTAIRQDGEQWIWFHAASVGEFEQGRPIIERLRKEHPEYKILLTFFSPSGYEMRKDYDKVDAVMYLPFATRRNARKMISLLKPKMAIFIKYEYWPAYLKELRRQGIDTYIISAIFRPYQAFFRWWGGAYRKLLKNFTTLYVQDEASKDLLAKYGIENVVVTGDTRFDRVEAIAAQQSTIDALEQFSRKGKKTIIAGSTWSHDEKLLVRYLNEHEDAVSMVIVPHELTAKHLDSLFQLLQGRFVLLSQASKESLRRSNCLVVDTMGLLSKIYRYADVTYIGGGFGAGIHNTIEAAVYGKPVVFGPKNEHFREAQNLILTGGGYEIKNYADLEQCMDTLLADNTAAAKAAREYVVSELGATDKIYTTLFNTK